MTAKGITWVLMTDMGAEDSRLSGQTEDWPGLQGNLKMAKCLMISWRMTMCDSTRHLFCQCFMHASRCIYSATDLKPVFGCICHSANYPDSMACCPRARVAVLILTQAVTDSILKHIVAHACKTLYQYTSSFYIVCMHAS